MLNSHTFTSSLTPAQLTALIAHHLDWQVCFLNDHHRPVIGILPKVSWQVSSGVNVDNNNLLVKRTVRDGVVLTYPSHHHAWEQELIAYGEQYINIDKNQAVGESYQHGLMGFIGYDVSANALNANITIKDAQPCAYMGHYDLYIRQCDGGFMLCGVSDDVGFDKVFQNAINALTDVINKPIFAPMPCQFYPLWQKGDYQTAFDKTIEYIKAGDTYQINLTQCWQADLSHELYHYLPSLSHKMNAPFATFLKLNDFEILSVSPELFFTFYKQDKGICIIIKPIKGTRPRHDDKIKDDELKNELANSEKDISENLMIVDLLRNDLGKYARVGGVKTPKRFEVESFKNVHHMVSTITAQLKDDTHPLTVLFGSLPAGSITGTPKKRACEIIHELEHHARGAYCGTMGYLNFDGTGQWNVLIRTLQAVGGQAELWAGGGVTIGSNCDDEYQECLDKVGVIMEIFGQSGA